MKYHLAIDLGASSGRHILGHAEQGKIVLEEVHRFQNGYEKRDGHFCWNTEKIFAEMLTGLKKCKELGKIPESVGIDTWGVDFVLLDKDENVLGNAVAYRDKRTKGMDEALEEILSYPEFYRRTGIQKQIFNTVYQLMALKKENPGQLEKAEHFLTIPDYLHYSLTGNMQNEYTIATTTALVNASSKEWDKELISMLGLPTHIFKKITPPGKMIGSFSKQIAEEVGYTAEVILPPSHDTASAFLAVPAESENAIYISSGTWSLLGVENKEPITNLESLSSNFTNEGGYQYRYRYLRNIMGLWILQSIRREHDGKFSFAEMSQMARKYVQFKMHISVNDNRFLAPASMTEEIKSALRETGEQDSFELGEIIQCVYISLVQSYKETIIDMQKITGKVYDCIHIVGGGSQDEYLNGLIAEEIGLPVFAGPTEGTALGNLMTQMIESGTFADVEESRKAVRNSFEIKEFPGRNNI